MMVEPKRKTSTLYRQSAAAFRWLHIYVSMLSFAALLFFALTGITLNHPTWFGASEISIRDAAAQLPAEYLDVNPLDDLQIAEYLRAEHHLKGRVVEFEINDAECMVVFKAPGYSADIFLDRTTGDYSLTESRSGIVAVLNDLHKGRDSGAGWALVIDISAVIMIVMALSGFGLLFYLKRRRAAGLMVSVFGTLALVFAWLLFVP